MPAAAVALAAVTKRYGRTVAVDNLSLAVEPGSFTTLLGPSGCGKTTLLRLIAGFLLPDSGDIAIDGNSVVDLPPYRRPTATVFQEYALFPHLSVFENIAYGLRLRRLAAEEVRARVRAVLDLLGIQGLEERSPGTLSGGQQQRVALARALVVEPRVLLMDEPLSNLDAKLRGAVRGELKALHQRLGITTLYVTHDQEEALFLSDWIGVMRAGQIVQYGSPQDIYDKPADPFVADFIGQVNFLAGVLMRYENGDAVIAIDGASVRVAAPGRTAKPQQPVRLAVRPTAMILSLERPQAGNVLQGTVRLSSYLGEAYRYFVTIGAAEIAVDQDGGRPLTPGTRVYVTLPREECWIFDDGPPT